LTIRLLSILTLFAGSNIEECYKPWFPNLRISKPWFANLRISKPWFVNWRISNSSVLLNNRLLEKHGDYLWSLVPAHWRPWWIQSGKKVFQNV